MYNLRSLRLIKDNSELSSFKYFPYNLCRELTLGKFIDSHIINYRIICDDKNFKNDLIEIINELPEIEKRIIELRYGVNDDKLKTQKEIINELHLTKKSCDDFNYHIFKAFREIVNKLNKKYKGVK